MAIFAGMPNEFGFLVKVFMPANGVYKTDCSLLKAGMRGGNCLRGIAIAMI
jgi:hypothetical protein